MARYGGANLYYTEYFRVYPGSVLNKHILRSITQNPTGQPVVAQLIGNNTSDLVRAARELQHYPIWAVDLNLGCPAPVVYRKCAGGGLLRDLPLIDRILGALREAIDKVRFTVKTRIGFDDSSGFEELLSVFARRAPDLVTVHARTVREMYRSKVHYEYIARAAEKLSCPVLANGNICSAEKALAVLKQTGARGLMIGRGAIRNPWLFEQITQQLQGEEPRLPMGREVLAYIRALYDTCSDPNLPQRSRIQRMKKYLNFIGVGIEPTGDFLHHVRRVTEESALFGLCDQFLDHDRPMPLEPYKLSLGEADIMAGEHH